MGYKLFKYTLAFAIGGIASSFLAYHLIQHKLKNNVEKKLIKIEQSLGKLENEVISQGEDLKIISKKISSRKNYIIKISSLSASSTDYAKN